MKVLDCLDFFFFLVKWRRHYFAEAFPLRCIGSFCLLVYRKVDITPIYKLIYFL